ncbi:hypothetical protein [Marinobacter mobilis]|uniref:hypothetical protein n=1 Tax=Marinobacter mobilis TaxID=488533 RepID=UPI00158760F4|nr:hypothetical protein [Marinobacter mobilis]
MIVTAQRSLGTMEADSTRATVGMVQDIAMKWLSATAARYGEDVSGLLNAA